ncbi:MAG TPA: ribonucleotide reductase subunit alpha [Noviherbaspirillum sp.]|uniref:ribonucleotide reductase subunit alpha n=1 Tax=Noviherbaspirillum sp. TaxID=1926288 RepID=UPI002B485D63|nr:ribonucleotide reductase subunit alpha [Noviherbaspirillum sp.]HJV87401.1 ribonucleotide reductase subunit alpha [Noviherbaspirillum sp.]
MNITSYTEFVTAAKRQPEPQRLLFVFAESSLPPNATESQKQSFRAQQGGTLTPIMCVDKLPGEAEDFAGLVEESKRTGQHWDIVFAASLSGRSGVVPSSDSATQALKQMISAIEQGSLARFLAFDRAGELVQFS